MLTNNDAFFHDTKNMAKHDETTTLKRNGQRTHNFSHES
jgi:hypothetical protein